jgi:8-oxo-dGTP pyrophosphatase MutT (NUDIX family)
VVIRDDQVVVIVPVKRAADGRPVVGLPKGHPDAGETPEAAAEREILEETGIRARLIEKLGDVQYQYERKRRPVSKTVAFYLFEYCSGDVADHDHEVEEARWMPVEEAVQTLTFEGEREMVGRALSRLASDR